MSACWTCGMPIGFCIPAAHRLADRIANLEAGREHFNCSHGADASDCPKTAAAGPIPPGYKLAPGWEGDGKGFDCTHTKEVRKPRRLERAWDCNTAAAFYCDTGDDAVASCAAHAEEMGALVKVEPPMAKPVHRSGTHFAEQPASAADEAACDCASRNACPAYGCGGSGPSGEWFEGHEVVCDDCGVSLMVDSIEKCGEPNCLGESTFSVMPDESMAEDDEPPAPAQGAPAEPLSARMRRDREELKALLLSSPATPGGAVGTLARFIGHEEKAASLEERLAEADLVAHQRAALLRRIDELNARLAAAELENKTLSTHCVRAERIAQERKARLAAAERERDEALVSVKQAVAAERERCLWWASNHTWPVHRDAIRAGRPAPK